MTEVNSVGCTRLALKFIMFLRKLWERGWRGAALQRGARAAQRGQAHASPPARGRVVVLRFRGPVAPSGLRLRQPAGRGQREEAAKAEIFLVHQLPLCGMGLESVGVRLTEAELRC